MDQRKLRAAVGFTVKSGWASAVVLAGPAAAPRVLDSRRVDLSDPAIPDSRQPYHAGFGTARPAGQRLSRLVESIQEYGRRSIARVIDEYEDAGYRLRRSGIIVGSLIEPEGIANDHIRNSIDSVQQRAAVEVQSDPPWTFVAWGDHVAAKVSDPV